MSFIKSTLKYAMLGGTIGFFNIHVHDYFRFKVLNYDQDKLITRYLKKENPDYELLHVYIEDKRRIDQKNLVVRSMKVVGYKTKEQLQCEEVFSKLKLDCKECKFFS